MIIFPRHILYFVIMVLRYISPLFGFKPHIHRKGQKLRFLLIFYKIKSKGIVKHVLVLESRY